MLNLKSLLTKIINNSIKITGDQNLLNGASTITGGTGTWDTATFRNSGSGGTIAYNQSITPPSGYSLPSKGAIITATAANTQIGFCQDGCPTTDSNSFSKEITMSVWVKGNAGDKVALQPIWSNASGQEESGSQTTTLPDSNWYHLSYTKTYNYSHASVSLGYVYYYAAAANNMLYVIAPKIEYSPVATAWVDNAKLSGALYVNLNQMVMGSKQCSASTIPALMSEVGMQPNATYQMGSINLTTAYTKNGITIPTGWYNYICMNGAMLLLGMTVAQKLYHIYNTSDPIIDEILIDNGTIASGYPSNTTTTYYNLNGVAGTHFYFNKYGNIVTAFFNVKCTSPSSGWSTFASGLPTHAHPTGITFPLACESPGYKPIWCRVNADGTLSAMTGTAGLYFYGSISYTAS